MEFYVNHLTGRLDQEDSADDGPTTLLAEASITPETSVQEEEAYRPVFPLLDTILEETTEDLLQEDEESPSAPSSSGSPHSSTSSSGSRWVWGWGWLNTSSDDDASSVIHCPPLPGLPGSTISGNV